MPNLAQGCANLYGGTPYLCADTTSGEGQDMGCVEVPLKVGDSQVFTKTISESDVYMFAGITGDFSPFHTNAEYMKKTEYGQRLVHGVLTFALSSTASTLIHQAYDEEYPVVSYGYDHVRFTGPVFMGDTITCLYVIDSIDYETGKTVAKVTITNQHGDVVCVCDHILKYQSFVD